MSQFGTITIAIPYYQRESGVLRRALQSIVTQKDCGFRLHVIVVDDESPIPAETEVASIEIPQDIELTVIGQANAGPGAARNTAITHASPETTYIAFLDSDDEWSNDHLHRAVQALEQGYDFYFANHLQLGANLPAFERAGRINPDDHPLIGGTEGGLHEYQGDLFLQILTANVIGTPTVVYRLSRFRDQRFRSEFRSAGEDYVFWMEIARAGGRAAFSRKVGAVCGQGVNVYARSGWGTDGFSQRLHDEMRFKKFTIRLFELSPDMALGQMKAVRALRRLFIQDILHRLSHRKPLNWPVIRKQLAGDPLTFASTPLAMLDLVRKRI